ncbi:MAG: hypothetical protein KDD67_00825 [Ignavibacteriae bacterium]|nr:hypothetical protein [Ignavibacteriota bacterium]MCB9216027.1 hypothetical protein [Ignavibacteria bacterium]
MDINYTVPVGQEVVGRILSAGGKTIDGRGELLTTRVPVVDAHTLRATESDAVGTKSELFEIGIKPFDLFAPVPRNGVISLIAAWGVGKVVLLHELMRTMKMCYRGRTVVVTVAGGPGELEDMKTEYQESGILDSMTAILLEKDALMEERRSALLDGLTIARHWNREEGRNVLFIVDQLALDEETAPLLRTWGSSERGACLTLISGFSQDELERGESLVDVEADTEIALSGDLSRRGLYPAIDPLKSSSRLFQDQLIEAEHRRVREETLSVLSKGARLVEKSSEALTEEEKRELDRARRIEHFLTQPFYVAQLHNNIPGVQVPLAETLRSLQGILSGVYDHLPTEELLYTGALEYLQPEL